MTRSSGERPFEDNHRAKTSGSGRGCRPFFPVFGAERSRSRCANTAPGMWDSRYWLSPQSGLARSCRQSNNRQGVGSLLSSSVETSMQPLVEVHFGVLHRRLAGAGVVQALLVKRAPDLLEALADLVVLDRRLGVGRLLRLDEVALEQGNL